MAHASLPLCPGDCGTCEEGGLCAGDPENTEADLAYPAAQGRAERCSRHFGLHVRQESCRLIANQPFRLAGSKPVLRPISESVTDSRLLRGHASQQHDTSMQPLHATFDIILQPLCNEPLTSVGTGYPGPPWPL